MELFKQAEQLLDRCGELAVSSVTEDGYPRCCILSKIKTEGLKTIYLSTGTSSKKTVHYRTNPKAGITFHDKGDSVTMLGKMEIVGDKALKDSLWQDWFFDHFPKGKDDPEYTILKFTAEEATIWINMVFDTIKL